MIAEVRANLETGIFPAVSKDNAAIVESNPAIIFIILEVLVYGFTAKKTVSNDDYYACSILLTDALSNIRYALERGYTWAEDIIGDFQKIVVQEVFDPQLDHRIANLTISAIQEAKLELSEEIKLAAQEYLDHVALDEDFETTADMGNIFDGIATMGIESPFVIFEILTQQMSVMPLTAQIALVCEMFTAAPVVIRELAVVTLLHPNKELRAGVINYITQAVSKENLTPTSLRRMIGIRNWLPEEERPKLDAVIKRARKLGVECASWPKAEIGKITATEFDGAGAQGILIVSKNQEGNKLSGFIAKEGMGIRDPWCSPEAVSQAQIDKISKEMTQTVVSHQVNSTYLNKLVAYYLWLGISKEGQPPAVGFLELAETVGVSDWRAEPFDIHEELSYLLANIDVHAMSNEFIEESLHRSKTWLEKQGLTPSWFEDDAEVEKIIQSGIKGKRRSNIDEAFLHNIVLEKVLEPRREKWAHRFVWMALWAKEIPNKKGVVWSDFAVMAHEIFKGRPLREIPVFATISAETVAMMA
ncbi:hypothetical protein BH10PSE19_BH10PSE19_05710 [soil metagenome]